VDSIVALTILGLGAALFWLFRRIRLNVPGILVKNDSVWKPVSRGRTQLSPSNSIHVIQVADRVLVVASHSSGCNLLASWDEEGSKEEQRCAHA
jgi:flagellar biogenesis protein FliO